MLDNVNVPAVNHSIDSISNLNNSKSIENSLQSLENAINFEKKTYSDYKKEKLKELEKESKRFINSFEFEKAVVVLKKLIFFDNQNAQYYLQLGKLYIKLQDISSAISCYKKSLLLDKNNKSTLRTLEKLLFAKGIINLEEGKINKEILKQIKEGMNKTIALLSVGKKGSGIKELEKILSSDKDHIEALLLLGKVYLNEGKYRESSVYLWRVHSINPEYSEITQYVSIMKMKMHECLAKANENVIKGKTEMGLLWSIKALSLYPNHPEALLLRSAIYRKMGKFNESLGDLNLASAHMLIDNCSEKVLKQISLTYNELGSYLLNHNNLLEAARFLDEAIKFKNNDLVAHFNKGECLLKMKDINSALKEYLTCLEIDPGNREAKARCAMIYYKYAIISFNNKEYTETLMHLDKAIVFYDRSPHIYVLKARCQFRLQSVEKGLNDIKKALEIDPHFKDALEIKKMYIHLL